MFHNKKDFFLRIVKNRILILMLILLVLMVVVVQHLFKLQIIQGESYQSSYTTSIQKTITTNGIRGNIYDKNGELLAYNELAYTVSIQDSGTYSDTEEKNESLNSEMDELITLIEKNGDEIQMDFHITMDKETGALSFDVSGTSLQRFRADVYGESDINDLTDAQSVADEQQIYDYLLEEFGLEADSYETYRTFQIVVLRYNLYTNSYQKYVTVPIATDVSDETVAAVKENASELEGVSIEEDTKRVYVDSEYYSSIIGYTGTISSEEYEEYSETDDSYTTTDTVGKAGIEQYMESELRGETGSQTVLVNNVGKVQSIISETEATTGNDVYLSIDADLQKTVYQLLEQEIAGILYTSIRNTKTGGDDDDDVYTPVYDVYTALLTNNVLDTDAMADADTDSIQYDIYTTFQKRKETITKRITNILSDTDEIYADQTDEIQDILTYIVTDLQSDGIFDADAVDSSDSTYKAWKNGEISIRKYLQHAINEGWLSTSVLDLEDSYSDTTEIYSVLAEYIISRLEYDDTYEDIIYEYLVLNDRIDPYDICMALYEQGVLDKDSSAYTKLKNRTYSTYTFIKARIKNLDITPAQLGLDPCSGSCVIMDPDDGSVLACVSYPGYDSNELSNSSDSSYYNDLLNSASLPLYNKATQQTTAPGSTYKLLTAVAGCQEGVITTSSTIKDESIFDKAGMSLRCWIYPGTHGSETLTSAIKDSCNYFFCEVGYRLSTVSGEYDESDGLEILEEYATAFGLATKTGLEISESNSTVADELPVSAAIGQSNNAYTTVQLARYVAAVANEGTVYDLTILSKLTDSEGNVLETYEPEVYNEIEDVSSSTWAAIKKGMRQVVLTHDQFDDIEDLDLAGKTGTAQETDSPNHALFVGYAPYSDPEIAIAARIANGYSSGNACDFVDTVMKYYYGTEDLEDLVTGKANTGSSSNSVDD